MLISGWEAPLGLLKAELQQLTEEGYMIPEELRRRCLKLRAPEELWSPELESIREELTHLPLRSDWPYEEPDELDEIRRLRPQGPRRLALHCSDRELLERYHVRGAAAAWAAHSGNRWSASPGSGSAICSNSGENGS